MLLRVVCRSRVHSGCAAKGTAAAAQVHGRAPVAEDASAQV